MTLDREARYRQLGLWTSERIGWFMTVAAGRYGDRECILFDGNRYSYEELNRWVISASRDLVAQGVKPGDKVMLLLSNSMELVVLTMATWRIGAVGVPVIPIYRAHELTTIIDITRPTVIAASRSFGARQPYTEIDEILPACGHRPLIKMLVGEGSPVAGWTGPPLRPALDADLSEDGLPEPAAADECCTIMFTSGTTSKPKGVMLNSRAMYSSMQATRSTLNQNADYTALNGSPLAHVAGMSSMLLNPLSVGGRVVIMKTWNADEAIDLIEGEGATYIAGARVFLQDIVERYEGAAASRKRLKMFFSGGAPMPAALVYRAEALGISVYRAYGMTEVAGPAAYSPYGSSVDHRANDDGRPLFGTEIEIVDDHGQTLPDGEIGNIRIRSPQLMMGYTDAKITAEQVDRDGWFYTGDVGRMSADGWLTMTGRTKDIINRGGEKFSAQDIEAALCGHAAVQSAAVIGVPHERLGEAVAAFIVLRSGVEWSGPDPILKHLDDIRMARSKFPVEWRIIAELPTTASGKIQKHKLLEVFAASAIEPGPARVSA